MTKEFIPYEEALALKELGFNEECFAVYSEKGVLSPITNLKPCNSNVPSYATAPLYQQAFRWFREKYGLMHIINPYHFTAEINYLKEKIVDEKHGEFIPHDHLVDDEGEELKHSSYEEAEQECLKKLIEIVKEKQL